MKNHTLETEGRRTRVEAQRGGPVHSFVDPLLAETIMRAGDGAPDFELEPGAAPLFPKDR